MTFDLGRVTTLAERWLGQEQHCGDVRSRTSYNFRAIVRFHALAIAVTFDLGRVTTTFTGVSSCSIFIAVTFDLGRVTTVTTG